MAPTRAFWKGYLKLSLVSCPIALYPGTSSTERVSFRQINKKTGNRLRQQLVDEVTREVVEGDLRRLPAPQLGTSRVCGPPCRERREVGGGPSVDAPLCTPTFIWGVQFLRSEPFRRDG
jgi:hypothetical protein